MARALDDRVERLLELRESHVDDLLLRALEQRARLLLPARRLVRAEPAQRERGRRVGRFDERGRHGRREAHARAVHGRVGGRRVRPDGLPHAL